MRRALAGFGARGALATLGLGLLAGGLAMIDVALALIVSGALLFALAVAPVLLMRGREGP